MTDLQFRRATKQQARLRMAIDGPSGAGKTYTGLLFAFELAKATGSRVAVIDTEHASAAKYADLFPEFDVLALDTFSPETYTEAIQLAEKAGYGVLVIDSLSHAWDGTGGALEQVDKAAARQQGNSYTAWRDVTPLHRQMIEAILQSECHVIATMRSKMEYVLQEEQRNGRTIQVPRKIGMAPIQRQGMEYEFDIVADMDIDHRLVVSKSRCFAVADNVTLRPKGKWMQPIIAWLTSGGAVKAEPEHTQPPVQVQSEPEQEQPRANGARPYAAAQVKKGVARRAQEGAAAIASQPKQGLVVGTLEQLFPNTDDATARKAARYGVTNYLLGKTSSKTLTVGECDALLAWATTRDADGVSIISDHAIVEAERILAAVGEAAGQQALFGKEG